MEPDKESQKELPEKSGLELSETPDTKALKLKPLPMKWIVVGMVSITALVFGYSFNNFQKKVIEENKQWAQKNKESEEFYKTFDAKAWNESFKLRVPFKDKFESLVNSYMATLEFTPEEKKKYYFNYEPKRFQQAQQEFIALKAEYAEYKDPDFSNLITKNGESFQNVNDNIKEHIALMMPFWEYVFEKASNADTAKKIYIDFINYDMSEEEMKKACERIKEVPNMNYENFSCK